MHNQFADWYQPVTFGHDRDTIDLRWQGVEAALEGVRFSEIADLTRFVFGQKLSSEASLGEFRQYFKEIDPTFKSTGNEEEIMVLAGCVLAALCDKGDMPTLLAILTTSAFGNRTLKVDIDLLNMAEHKVHIQGLESRNRPDLAQLNKIIETKEIKEAVQLISVNPDPNHAAQALQKLAPFYQQLVNHQKKTSSNFNKILNLIKIQDEELQILWWIISGWSNMWSLTFESFDVRAQPILLAKEAATITIRTSEPPSLKAVFQRVGINNQDKQTFPESINACGVDKLEKLVSDGISCPILFPIHVAISRAFETNAKQSWIASWSELSGIKRKASVSLINLAVQMYRECKLISYIEHNA